VLHAPGSATVPRDALAGAPLTKPGPSQHQTPQAPSAAESLITGTASLKKRETQRPGRLPNTQAATVFATLNNGSSALVNCAYNHVGNPLVFGVRRTFSAS